MDRSEVLRLTGTHRRCLYPILQWSRSCKCGPSVAEFSCIAKLSPRPCRRAHTSTLAHRWLEVCVYWKSGQCPSAAGWSTLAHRWLKVCVYWKSGQCPSAAGCLEVTTLQYPRSNFVLTHQTRARRKQLTSYSCKDVPDRTGGTATR